MTEPDSVITLFCISGRDAASPADRDRWEEGDDLDKLVDLASRIEGCQVPQEVESAAIVPVHGCAVGPEVHLVFDSPGCTVALELFPSF